MIVIGIPNWFDTNPEFHLPSRNAQRDQNSRSTAAIEFEIDWGRQKDVGENFRKTIDPSGLLDLKSWDQFLQVEGPPY